MFDYIVDAAISHLPPSIWSQLTLQPLAGPVLTPFSRSRIFQLLPLQAQHLRAVVHGALADPVRGYGRLHVTLDDDAREHLIDVANGDARGVLNALELAVETTEPALLNGKPAIHITLEIAEESIQRRAVLYDKEGDYHFDTISAFIKSLRGSDPDAALYWMAKMIYAGESPRFIFRRMLIFASEDVGLADPNAVQVVVACAHSFEQVGLPEGRFPLSQAALYLATAPKSNTTMALFDALATVEQEADSGVPAHLRDASRDAEGFGHGEGYLYPHAFRDHWVAQQYLPTSLQGKVFYQPSDQGYEARIHDTVARRREAQLAAMLEAENYGAGMEILTFSPQDSAKERWLQRTISSAGDRLSLLRDRVLTTAGLVRHSLVLDLKAGSGLLTWEALRRVPEGGVYALARSARDADALRQLAARMDEVERPQVLCGAPDDLPALLADVPGLRFDVIVGYNALLDGPDKLAWLRLARGLLAPGGCISLAERIPRHTQRLVDLVDTSSLPADLVERLLQAEEAIYADVADPLVNWDTADLVAMGRAAGLVVDAAEEEESTEVQVTAALLERWFGRSSGGRPSYADHLAARLRVEEIAAVRDLFQRQLLQQVVSWRGRVVYLTATLAAAGAER